MCESITQVFICGCKQHSRFQSCGVKRDRITNSAPICKVVPKIEEMNRECRNCILKRTIAESRARHRREGAESEKRKENVKGIAEKKIGKGEKGDKRHQKEAGKSKPVNIKMVESL